MESGKASERRKFFSGVNNGYGKEVRRIILCKEIVHEERESREDI